MISPRDTLLQRRLQNRTLDREPDQSVSERLDPIDLTKDDRALGKVGPNAAVVHDRHVRAARGTLRVCNETPQPILVTHPRERHFETGDHALGDVANRLLLAADRFGQCDIRLHLIDIRRHELSADRAAAAAANEVDHADGART